MRELNENRLHLWLDGVQLHKLEYGMTNRQMDWWTRRSYQVAQGSPDLTPLNFFFLAHIKLVVNKTKPANLQDLLQRITKVCHSITSQIFEKVR